MGPDHLPLYRYMKLGGEDWRNSSYLYAISATQTSIFQMTSFLSTTLDTIGSLCQTISTLEGESSQYCAADVCDLSKQPNILDLVNPDQLPSHLEANPTFIRQGTDIWLEIRKCAPVTGDY